MDNLSLRCMITKQIDIIVYTQVCKKDLSWKPKRQIEMNRFETQSHVYMTQVDD